VINGSDPNCVPYNIWSLGQVTPEALAYLQTPGFQKGSTSQTVQGINLSTDLGEYGMKLPTSDPWHRPRLGWEHRTEKLDLATDTAFETGDLAGQGGPTHGVPASSACATTTSRRAFRCWKKCRSPTS
jgi:iron complex outermembrane receptor protein